MGALKDGCGTGTAPCPPCFLVSPWFPCLAIRVFSEQNLHRGLAGTCPEELKASQEEEAATAEHLRVLRGAFPSSPISARETSSQPWLGFNH